jgi:hemerythrin-like domain-containing protein/rubredoxin
MREHRTIEKMITRLSTERESVQGGKLDGDFFDDALDFLRTYADRTHHGKEEDILFRDLAGKGLTPEQRRIMGELIREHSDTRRYVAAMADAKERYMQGEKSALIDLGSNIGALVELYPAHIEKEDRRFFYPVMVYFSDTEKVAMMRAFEEFDGKMIHERYGGLAVETMPQAGAVVMRCTVCGYVYDPSQGDPEHGVKPGTPWDDLPTVWVCPICHAAKSLFEKMG